MPPPPVSSATHVLTLDIAVRLALENNPELRASSGRVDAAAGRAYQAKHWTNPELNLNAEDWPVSGGGDFSDAKQTIGVAQTMPFPGKKTLDRQMGVSGVRLSEAELALRRTELVRDVKTAFYRVLASERLVEVSRRTGDGGGVFRRHGAQAGGCRGGGRSGAVAGGDPVGTGPDGI